MSWVTGKLATSPGKAESRGMVWGGEGHVGFRQLGLPCDDRLSSCSRDSSSVVPSMLAVSVTLGSMVAKASVLKSMCLASLCAIGAGPCGRLGSSEADAETGFGTNISERKRKEAGLGRERGLIEIWTQQISAKPMGGIGTNITCQSISYYDKMPGPTTDPKVYNTPLLSLFGLPCAAEDCSWESSQGRERLDACPSSPFCRQQN